MWVRGLKPANHVVFGLPHGSHPMWVRGLKQNISKVTEKEQNVAPHVGAWIETC